MANVLLTGQPVDTSSADFGGKAPTTSLWRVRPAAQRYHTLGVPEVE